MKESCIVFGNTMHSGKGITAKKEAVGYSVSLCEVINTGKTDGMTFGAFDYDETDILETYVKLNFVSRKPLENLIHALQVLRTAWENDEKNTNGNQREG